MKGKEGIGDGVYVWLPGICYYFDLICQLTALKDLSNPIFILHLLHFIQKRDFLFFFLLFEFFYLFPLFHLPDLLLGFIKPL